MNKIINTKDMNQKKPLIVAHRGVAGGNIPCNTLAAFEISLRQGTDIVECDVTMSTDGKLYIFHPGMELPHLKLTGAKLLESTSEVIEQQLYVNQDLVSTVHKVNTLDEALEFLKGRCLINLDRCWDYYPQVVDVVRRHNMVEQIILKSAPKQKFFDVVSEIAPDIAYMPIISEVDECSHILESMNINYVGAEVLFTTLQSQTASPEYIESMHKKGKLLWANSIVFNHKKLLAAGLNDDNSLTGDPDKNWGKLIDMGFDIIQTDWPGMLTQYIANRK